VNANGPEVVLDTKAIPVRSWPSVWKAASGKVLCSHWGPARNV